jgi:hypothetical protein
MKTIAHTETKKSFIRRTAATRNCNSALKGRAPITFVRSTWNVLPPLSVRFLDSHR